MDSVATPHPAAPTCLQMAFPVTTELLPGRVDPWSHSTTNSCSTEVMCDIPDLHFLCPDDHGPLLPPRMSCSPSRTRPSSSFHLFDSEKWPLL